MALPFGLWYFPGLSLLIISVECIFHNNSDGFPLIYNVLTMELQGGGPSDSTTFPRLSPPTPHMCPLGIPASPSEEPSWVCDSHLQAPWLSDHLSSVNLSLGSLALSVPPVSLFTLCTSRNTRLSDAPPF